MLFDILAATGHVAANARSRHTFACTNALYDVAKTDPIIAIAAFAMQARSVQHSSHTSRSTRSQCVRGQRPLRSSESTQVDHRQSTQSGPTIHQRPGALHDKPLERRLQSWQYPAKSANPRFSCNLQLCGHNQISALCLDIQLIAVTHRCCQKS